MAGRYDMPCYQGETFYKKIQWKDVNNVIVPVTGLKCRMQFRARTYDGPVLLELTTENGGITLDLVNNKFVLMATAIQTQAIPNDNYLYDIEVIDPIGTVKRIMMGKVKFYPNTTK